MLSGAAALGRLEAVVDASAVAATIEGQMPVGVRPRQLSVRTLLIGLLLTLADGRPAHLARIHAALVSLPEGEQWRLGVVAEWTRGPHRLTYRQVERTFGLIVAVFSKEPAEWGAADSLQGVVDALLEASIPPVPATSSLALDWTDVESFSTRRTKDDGHYADPEAAWGTARAVARGRRTSCSSATTSPSPPWWPRRPARRRPSSSVACSSPPVTAIRSRPWWTSWCRWRLRRRPRRRGGRLGLRPPGARALRPAAAGRRSGPRHGSAPP